MSMDKKNEYSNGELTLIWKPDRCMHSTNCWKGLINVFDPRKLAWINIEGADSETLAKQAPYPLIGTLMNTNE